MSDMTKRNGFVLLPLSVAITSAAAAQGAAAQEMSELERLTTPSSEASIGLGVVSEDNNAFGLYNGLEEGGAYPLLDFDINRRDDETGTWTRAEGRDLGLDAQELRFGQQRQGDWEYFVEYGELTRHHPYEVDTSLNGIGDNNQTFGTVLRDRELELDRERFKVGVRKFLTDAIDLKVTYRHEEKEGDRAWGVANLGGNGYTSHFVTEPVDYRIDEVNAILGYTGDKLQLSGGYLASLFGNKHKVLNNESDNSELSLPLDNQSHQLYVNGGYSFTPATRASFKAAYDRVTQDDTFYMRSPVNGASTLDGEVINTELMARLTSRPMDRLYVKGQFRYDDRDDKTPQRAYINDGGDLLVNEVYSITRRNSDLEATYTLSQGYGLTAGVEYDETDRSAPEERSTSYRPEVDEITYRLEVKRRLTDRLGGSLAYLRSDRDGSAFLESGNENKVDPINLADRERDKVRVKGNWLVNEALSIQLRFEQSWDDYDFREHGPRDGQSSFASVDASYALNDEWQLNAWLSRNEAEIEHQTQSASDSNGGSEWVSELSQLGRAFGMGLRGETWTGYTMGADLQMSLDQNEYLITGGEDLPKLFYRRWSLDAFVEKALTEQSSVRLDYSYSRLNTDDWTWQDWDYADDTTITQDSLDGVHFVGMSYQYRF